MTKQRLDYIDLAKGLCILCVILHHCYVEIDVKWLADPYFGMFRMPLYFCLSGAFFKDYDGFFDFFRRKTNKLLIPFVSFFLATSVLYPLVLIHEFNYDWKVTDFSLFYSWIVDRTTLYNGSLWFLLCLFEMNVFFYGLHYLSKRTQNPSICLLLACCLLGMIGFVAHKLKVVIPFYLDTSLTSMPFFGMGYFLFRHTLVFQPNVKFDRYLMPMSILLLSVPLFLQGRGDYYSNNIGSFQATYLSGLCGTLGILALAKRIGYIYGISYLGLYSIVSVCINSVVLHTIGPFVDSLSVPTAIKTFILFLPTFIFCIACIPLFRQFIPKFIAQQDFWTSSKS